jgi:hypothetical protein
LEPGYFRNAPWPRLWLNNAHTPLIGDIRLVKEQDMYSDDYLKMMVNERRERALALAKLAREEQAAALGYLSNARQRLGRALQSLGLRIAGESSSDLDRGAARAS